MCELSEWNNDSDVGQQRKLTMQNGTDFGGSIVIKGVPVRRDSGTLRYRRPSMIRTTSSRR